MRHKRIFSLSTNKRASKEISNKDRTNVQVNAMEKVFLNGIVSKMLKMYIYLNKFPTTIEEQQNIINKGKFIKYNSFYLEPNFTKEKLQNLMKIKESLKKYFVGKFTSKERISKISGNKYTQYFYTLEFPPENFDIGIKIGYEEIPKEEQPFQKFHRELIATAVEAKEIYHKDIDDSDWINSQLFEQLNKLVFNVTLDSQFNEEGINALKNFLNL
jgi:hypothetical protein